MYQPQTIDAQSLLEMLSKDGSCVLLDVRTETEQQEASLICNHLSIPLHQFDSAHFCESCGIDKNTPVYIICRSGARAHKAAQMLTDYGLPYAYVVDGGWSPAKDATTPSLKVRSNLPSRNLWKHFSKRKHHKRQIIARV